MTTTRPVAKGIRRYEHNYFKGYVVSLMRGGRKWTKYFSDKPDGPAAAVKRAKAFRDELFAELPWPSPVKLKYIRNTTGIVGVSRRVERRRNGSITIRWIALWPSRGGRTRKATFSVSRYGEAEARHRAIEARRRGLAELLEPIADSKKAVGVVRPRPISATPGRKLVRARRWRLGLKGISRVRSRVKGKWYYFYRARWSQPDGTETSVRFAIGKYGEDGARLMAIEARRQALAGRPARR